LIFASVPPFCHNTCLGTRVLKVSTDMSQKRGRTTPSEVAEISWPKTPPFDAATATPLTDERIWATYNKAKEGDYVFVRWRLTAPAQKYSKYFIPLLAAAANRDPPSIRPPPVADGCGVSGGS